MTKISNLNFVTSYCRFQLNFDMVFINLCSSKKLPYKCFEKLCFENKKDKKQRSLSVIPLTRDYLTVTPAGLFYDPL
jgi:hypothetical protein